MRMHRSRRPRGASTGERSGSSGGWSEVQVILATGRPLRSLQAPSGKAPGGRFRAADGWPSCVLWMGLNG